MGPGAAPVLPCAIHRLNRTETNTEYNIILYGMASVLFPGMWRRMHAHLDAGRQVRIRYLPVTLVLASLPEDDPGREVQVRRG